MSREWGGGRHWQQLQDQCRLRGCPSREGIGIYIGIVGRVYRIHFPEISHTVLSVINSFHVQVEPVPFALVAVPVTLCAPVTVSQESRPCMSHNSKSWCDSLRGVPRIAPVAWRWHHSRRRRDRSRVLSVCICATGTSLKGSQEVLLPRVWRVAMSLRLPTYRPAAQVLLYPYTLDDDFHTAFSDTLAVTVLLTDHKRMVSTMVCGPFGGIYSYPFSAAF